MNGFVPESERDGTIPAVAYIHTPSDGGPAYLVVEIDEDTPPFDGGARVYINDGLVADTTER